jgi:peroxiredoxin
MRKALCAVLMLSAQPVFALGVGDAAPCVVLQDIQPDATSEQDCVNARDAGTSFVLLDFFSTSCGDCSKNLPKLSALEKDIAVTTTVRLVGIDRDINSLLQYIQVHHALIDFAVALDVNRDAKQAYGVKTTPSAFVIDSNGRVIYAKEGPFDDNELETIRELVH